MAAIKIHCPSCKKTTYTRSIPTYKIYQNTNEGDPKARLLCNSKHADILWYRRGRECQICGKIFLSAELDESFIEELVQLRELVIERNIRIIRRIKRNIHWIKYDEKVPEDFAKSFIRACAWWDKHPSGFPARAPRHADNIYLSSYYGWVLEFGANKFLVGKAIIRSANVVNTYIENAAKGTLIRKNELVNAISNAIAGSVANFYDDEYYTYPIYSGQLEFGVHAIDLADAAEFLIKNSDLEGLFV
ncbi:hypothetical protein GCM10028803_31450 [Larkinella knui]|uniref:Uncharacterized protein n=1 Tax=Larkinella knui TaxID=2025310 RepID=A0A3P1CXU3_9BACT|nr:hypothetical protein [Larkinella knui]RRB18171.1 hypothetical protein EHT87_07810 [Larkinella knui]